MTAIATHPTAIHRSAVASPIRPVRRVAPAAGRGRPALRLVPPSGRSSAPTVAGRSLGAVVAAVLLAVVVLAAVGYLVRTPAVGTGTAGLAPAATPHVVAEGETMWSIAVEHAPAGEAAVYVERLVAANGGASVAAGQVLTLPRP